MNKLKKRHYFFIPALALADMGAVVLAFQAAFWLRFQSPHFLSLIPVTKGIPQWSLYVDSLQAVLPVWLLVFIALRFYSQTLASAYDEFVRTLKGVIVASFVTMAMSFAYRGAEYSRIFIGAWGLLSVLFVFGFRQLAKTVIGRLLRTVVGRRPILVLGHGAAVDAIRQGARHDPTLKLHFEDRVPGEPALSEKIVTQRIEEVIMLQGSLSNEQILETARLCERLGVDARVVPDLFELRRGQIILHGFLGLPTFHIKSLSLHGAEYWQKRLFDLAVSLIVLTFLAIPLLLIALWIKLDSHGPVLFSQDRMGLRGRKFKCFKFRTMIIGADAQLEKLRHLSDRAGPVFKMKNDPRITRAGKWLRMTSLDEIPQLINVLQGDMSLVGPRPQVLWEAAAYDDHAKKRLRVLPGITGLWQVSGRAALSYEQMIDLDVFYVENWSLGLDLKIILHTIPAVFAKEGAY